MQLPVLTDDVVERLKKAEYIAPSQGGKSSDSPKQKTPKQRNHSGKEKETVREEHTVFSNNIRTERFSVNSLDAKPKDPRVQSGSRRSSPVIKELTPTTRTTSPKSSTSQHNTPRTRLNEIRASSPIATPLKPVDVNQTTSDVEEKAQVRLILEDLIHKKQQRDEIEEEQRKLLKQREELEHQVNMWMEEKDIDKLTWENRGIKRKERLSIPRISVPDVLDIVSKLYGERSLEAVIEQLDILHKKHNVGDDHLKIMSMEDKKKRGQSLLITRCKMPDDSADLESDILSESSEDSEIDQSSESTVGETLTLPPAVLQDFDDDDDISVDEDHDFTDSELSPEITKPVEIKKPKVRKAKPPKAETSVKVRKAKEVKGKQRKQAEKAKEDTPMKRESKEKKGKRAKKLKDTKSRDKGAKESNRDKKKEKSTQEDTSAKEDDKVQQQILDENLVDEDDSMLYLTMPQHKIRQPGDVQPISSPTQANDPEASVKSSGSKRKTVSNTPQSVKSTPAGNALKDTPSQKANDSPRKPPSHVSPSKLPLTDVEREFPLPFVDQQKPDKQPGEGNAKPSSPSNSTHSKTENKTPQKESRHSSSRSKTSEKSATSKDSKHSSKDSRKSSQNSNKSKDSKHSSKDSKRSSEGSQKSSRSTSRHSSVTSRSSYSSRGSSRVSSHVSGDTDIENERKRRGREKMDRFQKAMQEEIMKEKRELIYELWKMDRDGLPVSKRFTMEDSIDELRFEYHKLNQECDVNEKVRIGWSMFSCFNSVIEILNEKLDPFNFSIDGWGDQLDKEKEQYEPHFRKLYRMMSCKFQIKPGLQIAMLFTSHFMMFVVPRLLSKIKGGKKTAQTDARGANQDAKRQGRQQPQNTWSPPSNPPPPPGPNAVENQKLMEELNQMKSELKQRDEIIHNLMNRDKQTGAMSYSQKVMSPGKAASPQQTPSPKRTTGDVAGTHQVAFVNPGKHEDDAPELEDTAVQNLEDTAVQYVNVLEQAKAPELLDGSSTDLPPPRDTFNGLGQLFKVFDRLKQSPLQTPKVPAEMQLYTEQPPEIPDYVVEAEQTMENVQEQTIDPSPKKMSRSTRSKNTTLEL